MALLPSSIVALLLALGAPTAETGRADEASPTRPSDDAEELPRLREAIRAANEDPLAGAAELSAALEALLDLPTSSLSESEAQDLRIQALLTLARAHLANEDPEGAAEAMDEALRTSRGEPLPVQRFGPRLEDLHARRQAELDARPRGSLSVSCAVPCRVFVNERAATGALDDLHAGHYRVHVEPVESGTAQPLDAHLDIDGAVTLHWPEAPTPQPSPEPAQATPAAERRTLPRWLGIAMMGAGLVAVGVGAALVSLDGRCPDGLDPLDVEACPNVYTTQGLGIGALGVGAGLALTGGIILTVDEVRIGKSRGDTVGVAFRGHF